MTRVCNSAWPAHSLTRHAARSVAGSWTAALNTITSRSEESFIARHHVSFNAKYEIKKGRFAEWKVETITSTNAPRAELAHLNYFTLSAKVRGRYWRRPLPFRDAH